MNTVGYKRRRAEFQDLLYTSLERPGSQSSNQGTVVPTGVQIGGGVKAGAVYRITEQGTPTRTENWFDLSIQGRGYFQIQMPTGETAYTRAGNFGVNDQGQLVTSDGYLVQPGITIPNDATDVAISKAGQVQVTQPGNATPSVVGQLELATFVNEGGLDAIGDNLFLESGSSGPATSATPGAAGNGTLMQGYVESSNVDSVLEISALIVAQRAYEMNSKVVKAADDMLSVTAQMRT